MQRHHALVAVLCACLLSLLVLLQPAGTGGGDGTEGGNAAASSTSWQPQQLQETHVAEVRTQERRGSVPEDGEHQSPEVVQEWNGQEDRCEPLLQERDGSARLLDTPVQVTALASFPRSGNTWVRIFLQELTGVKSGSLYDDALVPPPLERVPGTERVYVVKTHDVSLSYTKRAAASPPSREVGVFRKVIWVVRNPFDCIWSRIQKVHSKSFTGSLSDLPDDAWEIFEASLEEWRRHSLYWISVLKGNKASNLFVRYEELVAHPAEEFRRIVEFLPIDVDEERFTCLVAEATCSHRPESCRSGRIGEGLQRLLLLDEPGRRRSSKTVRESALGMNDLLAVFGYHVTDDGRLAVGDPQLYYR